MNASVVPIFIDHSSYKSILTYDKVSDVVSNGPRSIIKLCKDNNIDTCYGVSNSFASFIDAYKNLRKEKIKFRFGLEVWMCDDAKKHDEDSLRNEHKITIFARNSKAYYDLIKIYSAIHSDKDNFYYKARFDFHQLNAMWTDNLRLVLPFFDSAIARNTIKYQANIVPDFPVAPVIFREQKTEHPMESVINNALNQFNKENKFEEVKTKTMYYELRKHIDEYTVYRCIHNRGTLFDEPRMDFFCSPAFSLEDYLKLR